MMSLSAIREIRVETNGNEVAYQLPVRPLGILRLVGVFPVLFSACWMVGLGCMPVGLLRQLPPGTFRPTLVALVVFLFGFMLIGCIPGVYGLLAMFGRCRITWRDERLTVSDGLGPFGWRRRMPRVPIRKFTVQALGPEQGRGLVGPMVGMATLLAEFESGKPRVLAAWYPRPWLEAVATDLSARAAGTQSAAPRVEVRLAGRTLSEGDDLVRQPEGSKVVMQRGNASIVLEVPPAGLRHGTMSLFPFAAGWCVITALFTFALIFGHTDPAQPPRQAWIGPVVLVVFWMAGAATLGLAINLGRRRATLQAGNSGLTVVQTGPFGVKRREFRRAEIAAIRADDSNVESNGRRLLELQIHSVTGRKVGLFVNRDAEELQWMAAELRKAVGVAARA